MKPNLLETAIEKAAYGFSLARSASFSLEFNLLTALSGGTYGGFESDAELNRLSREESFKLLKKDSENIRDGIYPPTVLMPESPVRHLLRIPRLMVDGLSATRRKKAGRTTVFNSKIRRELLDELPKYYRRNFHFQTDGYLSPLSAELWDHQVELLFQGTGDAMRRLFLPDMVSWARKLFGTSDGRGLHFLEIGASAGRATRFVKLAFPRAKITVSDLSEAYLRVAARKLSDLSRLDFIQADGACLPFKDEQFDAVYSVFLFHELPLEERKKMIAESRRVLKPGGFLGLVDSLQTDDFPAFNRLLTQFPVHFHEPFYRNYLEHPMEKALEQSGLRDVRKGTGFVSKYCVAIR